MIVQVFCAPMVLANNLLLKACYLQQMLCAEVQFVLVNVIQCPPFYSLCLHTIRGVKDLAMPSYYGPSITFANAQYAYSYTSIPYHTAHALPTSYNPIPLHSHESPHAPPSCQSRRATKSLLYCVFLIFSNCLITKKFASKNRSTQFFAQLSSVLSSFPLLIDPVMHFVQQISVRLCTATCTRQLGPLSRHNPHPLPRRRAATGGQLPRFRAPPASRGLDLD